jgi:hypothetical protein
MKEDLSILVYKLGNYYHYHYTGKVNGVVIVCGGLATSEDEAKKMCQKAYELASSKC